MPEGCRTRSHAEKTSHAQTFEWWERKSWIIIIAAKPTGHLLYSDYRCDGVVATFLALPPSRLVWPRWWLASWETVTFKNTTGEEEISRKAVFHYLQAVSSSWAWCCVSDSSLMWWQLCYIRTVLCERGQGNIQWSPLVGIFSHQFVFFS